MGKLQKIQREVGANIRESIGATKPTDPKRTLAVHAPPENLRRIEPARDFVEIPVDLIERDPKQPRRTFDPDALRRLAANLKARGQLHPVRVIRKGTSGRFVVVAGERRWRAAKEAGIEHLVCRVLDRRPTEAEIRSEQLAENCAREDLAPMELARALEDLRVETGWSQSKIADEVGLSQQGIGQKLALLKLPPPVQAFVATGYMAETTALELLRLPRPADQIDLAAEAAEDGWTRERVRHAVAQLLAASNSGRSCVPPDDDAIRESVEASAEGGIATAGVQSHRIPMETGGGGRKEPPGTAATDSPSAPPTPAPARAPWLTCYYRHDAKAGADIFTYATDDLREVRVKIPDECPDRDPTAVLEAVLAEVRRRRQEGGPSS